MASGLVVGSRPHFNAIVLRSSLRERIAYHHWPSQRLERLTSHRRPPGKDTRSALFFDTTDQGRSYTFVIKRLVVDDTANEPSQDVRSCPFRPYHASHTRQRNAATQCRASRKFPAATSIGPELREYPINRRRRARLEGESTSVRLSERYVASGTNVASVPLRGDSRFPSLTSSNASFHAASLPCSIWRRAIAGNLTRSTAIIAVRRGSGSHVTSTLAWRIWRASVHSVSKPCRPFIAV